MMSGRESDWQADAPAMVLGQCAGLLHPAAVRLERVLAPIRQAEIAGTRGWKRRLYSWPLALVSLYAIRWAPIPCHLHHPAGGAGGDGAFSPSGRGRRRCFWWWSIVLTSSSSQDRRTNCPGIKLLQVFLAVSSLITARTAMVLNERDLHLAIIERSSAPRGARLALQEPASVPCQPRSARAACRRSSAFPACWNPATCRRRAPRNSPISWPIMANCCSGFMTICST